MIVNPYNQMEDTEAEEEKNKNKKRQGCLRRKAGALANHFLLLLLPRCPSSKQIAVFFPFQIMTLELGLGVKDFN